ncbi:MAG TPA: LysR substrate-binding domain-containing protein [Chthoniobacteraceae bacterium]|nr:LysR substrate-binding domain-containing protein [Chthoniobacteraceae bacterium]
MDYSLRELECFLAVAKELSFTRAARRLHLAQPPLSRHIRTLEEKIGTLLFLREPRRISLTAAGALFYDEVHAIPKQLIRAGEAARRCGLGETARLRLGFVSAVMNDELADVFRSFRENHPQVQIMLHDLSPHEQIRAILEGNLDGGFIGLAPLERAEGLELLAWRREPLLCFVPRGHPLADRKRVALRDLAGESFIAVSGESAPAFAVHVRELCREAGFRPRIILESPRAQAVALMVAAGSGIAILPAALTGSIGASAVALALEGAPEITHVFAVRQGKRPAPLEALGEILY